jgi:hypothetical protein
MRRVRAEPSGPVTRRIWAQNWMPPESRARRAYRFGDSADGGEDCLFTVFTPETWDEVVNSRAPRRFVQLTPIRADDALLLEEASSSCTSIPCADGITLHRYRSHLRLAAALTCLGRPGMPTWPGWSCGRVRTEIPSSTARVNRRKCRRIDVGDGIRDDASNAPCSAIVSKNLQPHRLAYPYRSLFYPLVED